MASTSIRATALLVLPVIFGLLVPPCTADNILYSGETLTAGQALTYASYTFTIQTDCNLVLYDNGRALWASGTNNRASNCVLKMQADGNLVIYSNGGNGNAVWASNTSRQPQANYVLVLQKDRNVVIYGGAQWASNTNVRRSSGVIISYNVTNSPVLTAAEDLKNTKN